METAKKPCGSTPLPSAARCPKSSEGAHVDMPLADQFWGDYFGSLTDKYGVPWMINFNEAGVGG